MVALEPHTTEKEMIELNERLIPDKRVLEYLKANLNVERLRPWQIDCLQTQNEVLLDKNCHAHLLIKAPTAGGKSLLGDILTLRSVLVFNQPCLIILPYVALIQAKTVFFKNLLPKHAIIGLHHGVRLKDETRYDVMISTPERANSMILRSMKQQGIFYTASLLPLVIVDEIDMVMDPQRGVVYELFIARIRLLRQIVTQVGNAHEPMGTKVGQIIAMSATIDHPQLYAKWLGQDETISFIASESSRPHALTKMVVIMRGQAKSPKVSGPLSSELKRGDFIWNRLAVPPCGTFPQQEMMRIFEECYQQKSIDNLPSLFDSQYSAVRWDNAVAIWSVVWGQLLRGRSTLIFCSTRGSSQSLATLGAKAIPMVCTCLRNYKSMSLNLVRDIRSELLVRYRSVDQLKKLIASDPKLTATKSVQLVEFLLPFGISFHHSGLPTVVSSFVEEQFRAGTLRILCATSTLAVGVNLPVDTVIFEANHMGGHKISPQRFKQMEGRAGRCAGCQSPEVFCIVDHINELPDYLELMFSESSQVIPHSSIRSSDGAQEIVLSALRWISYLHKEAVHFKDDDYSSLEVACNRFTQFLFPPLSENDVDEFNTKLVTAIQTLIELNIITICDKESISACSFVVREQRYHLTHLGDAMLASPLYPWQGFLMYHLLHEDASCIALESDLQFLYLATLPDNFPEIACLYSGVATSPSMSINFKQLALMLVGLSKTESFVIAAILKLPLMEIQRLSTLQSNQYGFTFSQWPSPYTNNIFLYLRLSRLYRCLVVRLLLLRNMSPKKVHQEFQIPMAYVELAIGRFLRDSRTSIEFARDLGFHVASSGINDFTNRMRNVIEFNEITRPDPSALNDNIKLPAEVNDVATHHQLVAFIRRLISIISAVCDVPTLADIRGVPFETLTKVLSAHGNFTEKQIRCLPHVLNVVQKLSNEAKVLRLKEWKRASGIRCDPMRTTSGHADDNVHVPPCSLPAVNNDGVVVNPKKQRTSILLPTALQSTSQYDRGASTSLKPLFMIGVLSKDEGELSTGSTNSLKFVDSNMSPAFFGSAQSESFLSGGNGVDIQTTNTQKMLPSLLSASNPDACEIIDCPTQALDYFSGMIEMTQLHERKATMVCSQSPQSMVQSMIDIGNGQVRSSCCPSASLRTHRSESLSTEFPSSVDVDCLSSPPSRILSSEESLAWLTIELELSHRLLMFAHIEKNVLYFVINGKSGFIPIVDQHGNKLHRLLTSSNLSAVLSTNCGKFRRVTGNWTASKIIPVTAPIVDIDLIFECLSIVLGYQVESSTSGGGWVDGDVTDDIFTPAVPSALCRVDHQSGVQSIKAQLDLAYKVIESLDSDIRGRFPHVCDTVGSATGADGALLGLFPEYLWVMSKLLEQVENHPHGPPLLWSLLSGVSHALTLTEIRGVPIRNVNEMRAELGTIKSHIGHLSVLLSKTRHVLLKLDRNCERFIVNKRSRYLERSFMSCYIATLVFKYHHGCGSKTS
eukprot:GHVH01009176.1.p1 GENE.GHVH01009176.1~~GHVH01009176.1.p1  ORF type:complete len:1543 (-),score=222.65 GHVH01009176.1:1637-6088(-)